MRIIQRIHKADKTIEKFFDENSLFFKVNYFFFDEKICEIFFRNFLNDIGINGIFNVFFKIEISRQVLLRLHHLNSIFVQKGNEIYHHFH